MRITTLIENNLFPEGKGLKAEHALSFYIEVDGHAYLSDVGQSGGFAENARKLGADITKVEAVAISHHHYDHGGGLGCFFDQNDRATVYLREASTEDYVVDSPPDPLRYIGLDKTVLQTHVSQIEVVAENQEAAPGLHLLTEIPESYPKPDGDLRLQMLGEDGLKPDLFQHELVTVIEDEGGLVLLTGCAHNGVLNMLAAVRRAFPHHAIQAVVGGFHLHHEDRENIIAVGEYLLEEEIPVVFSGHCTGKKAMRILNDVLGDRFHKLFTGLVMDF